ncbi:MAG: hypothetical protein KAI81_01340 [Candidatus Marinimicrobia bacterium]|nr:hypothetical protein [Candidatus Neomarinimicrobiota bacterium]
MKQATRTWILLSILIVMIIYYLLNMFVFNKESSNSDRPNFQGKLSNTYENNTGLITKLEFPKIPAAIGSWRNDPFFYESPETKNSIFGNLLNELPLPGKSLQLKGIVWSDDIPTVLIDNEVLKLGDEINGYKIINVGRDYVTLRNRSEKLRLTIGD